MLRILPDIVWSFKNRLARIPVAIIVGIEVKRVDRRIVDPVVVNIIENDVVGTPSDRGKRIACRRRRPGKNGFPSVVEVVTVQVLDYWLTGLIEPSEGHAERG